MTDEQLAILRNTIEKIEKINEEMDEMLEDKEPDPEEIELLRNGKIRVTLQLFREICRAKNRPEMPCAGCPRWNVCGTLPGSLDDDTIENTARAAAAYMRGKEAADGTNP